MSRITLSVTAIALGLIAFGPAHAERSEAPVKHVAAATGTATQGFTSMPSGGDKMYGVGGVYGSGSRK